MKTWVLTELTQAQKERLPKGYEYVFSKELNKEEIKDVPLEKNDYLAMVLGAFWALWPVLAVVVGIIAFVLFFFFR